MLKDHAYVPLSFHIFCEQEQNTFVLEYLFKNIYIVNILERERSCPPLEGSYIFAVQYIKDSVSLSGQSFDRLTAQYKNLGSLN